MKRVLLAGVSLTVTACAMSTATPPTSLSSSTSRGAAPTHMLSLAPTPQCTLWRDVDGSRVCMDGAAAPLAEALPSLPASESPPPSQGAAIPVEKPPVAAPRIKVTSEPLGAPGAPGKRAGAEPPMPSGAAVTQQAQSHDLFVALHKAGMIKAPAPGQAAAMPRLPVALAAVPAAAPAAEEKTEANIDPKTAPIVASNDLGSLSRVAPGVFATDARRPVRVRQGFAPTSMDAPIATATAIAAPTSGKVAAASWQPPAQPPVEPMGATTAQADFRATQLADADPPAQRTGGGDTLGRAPVAAVERTTLPSVQAQRVVPLKIARKASDDAPAVVVPATSSTGTQIAGTLPPPLPALPPLPGETPGAASAPPPPAMPATRAASGKSTGVPLLPPAPPPLPDLARVEPVTVKPAPVKAPPLVAAPKPAHSARPAAPEAKLSRAALNHRAPADTRASAAGKPSAAKTTMAKPSNGRYLVLHSFREAARASRLAEQYSHLDAKVASVKLHGQTWHRVVVRDGAAQRSRLASDGVRGYWPVTL